MSWHAIYVHPRCEKKMAEYCAVLSLPFYLPLRRVTRVYPRRRATFEVPVFPGYVFCSFERDHRIALLQTNLIVRILTVADERRFLHELDQIREALAVDPTLVGCRALERGRQVRIMRGPFAGIEGVVAAVKSRTRVVLNVDLIGQGVAIEVDGDALEVLD